MRKSAFLLDMPGYSTHNSPPFYLFRFSIKESIGNFFYRRRIMCFQIQWVSFSRLEKMLTGHKWQKCYYYRPVLFKLSAGVEHMETFFRLAERLGKFLAVLRKKQHLLESIWKFCNDMKMFIFWGFTWNDNKNVFALTKYINKTSLIEKSRESFLKYVFNYKIGFRNWKSQVT